MIHKNNYALFVGKKLRTLRQEAGYTVPEFVKLVGYKSEQQLYRYERGMNKIDIDTLVMSLNVLNINVGQFFEDVINENKKE